MMLDPLASRVGFWEDNGGAPSSCRKDCVYAVRENDGQLQVAVDGCMQHVCMYVPVYARRYLPQVRI